jgi:hypothetical protein
MFILSSDMLIYLLLHTLGKYVGKGNLYPNAQELCVRFNRVGKIY